MDHREHYYAIARTRVLEQAKRDFNAEALYVEGFAPHPEVDPSWAGRVPDVASFVSNLEQELRVLTISRSGSLIIPQDCDIGVMLTPELRSCLDQWRKQWRYAAPTSPASAACAASTTETRVVDPAPPPDHTFFKPEAELLEYFDVVKVVPCGTRQLVVVKVKGKEFDPHGHDHSLWVKNPSALLTLVLDKDTDLCGCGAANLVVEGSEHCDPHAPCSVRWGLNRVPSNDNPINADQATIFYNTKDSTDLRMMSVAAALKDMEEYPRGSIFGFGTTVDGRRRVLLQPLKVL